LIPLVIDFVRGSGEKLGFNVRRRQNMGFKPPRAISGGTRSVKAVFGVKSFDPIHSMGDGIQNGSRSGEHGRITPELSAIGESPVSKFESNSHGYHY